MWDMNICTNFNLIMELEEKAVGNLPQWGSSPGNNDYLYKLVARAVDIEQFYYLSERFDFLAVLGVRSEDHISLVLQLILEFMAIHLIFQSRQNCWTCDRLTSPYFKYSYPM